MRHKGTKGMTDARFHPTILLGLDGATFAVLDALFADGRMPHLRRLAGEGVRAPLLSTPHPLTPPAWTTAATGRTPGHHGIFDFLRAERRAGGAFFTLNNFADIQTETIWSIVSRAGGRVLSVNYPLTAPPPRVSGTVIPGLMPSRHLRSNVHPPQAYERIKALTNGRVNELTWEFANETKALQAVSPDELERWVRFHITRETHWFNILRHFMLEEPCDLSAVVFDGVDKLQHACWRQLDPKCLPGRPNEFERRMRELCLEYFDHLDEFIGKIVEAAGRDARILVISDHGFGPTEKLFRVNNWLHSMGYLHWPAEDADARTTKVKAGHHVAIDMPRTKAFAQSGATNGIHIRLSERPGDNGVPPSEYEAFRDRLTSQLLSVRDPATGTAIVRQVLKREDIYAGPYLEKAPDLTLVMFDYGFISVQRGDELITTRPEVIGTHYPDGVLVAHGPGFAKGRIASRQSILDVAPTILHSLGLPIPLDFEGRVMDDAFEESFLAARPVRFGPATQSPNSESLPVVAEMSASDEEKVLDQLRALGYVE